MKTYTDNDPRGFCSAWADSPGNRPSVNPDHIDGPLLTFSDGQMHWLTLWERFIFWLRLTDAELLERRHRPNLMRRLGR